MTDEFLRLLAGFGTFVGIVAGAIVAIRKAWPPKADLTADAVKKVNADLEKARTEVGELDDAAKELRAEVDALRKTANAYADYVHALRAWIDSGQGPPPPPWPEGLRA